MATRQLFLPLHQAQRLITGEASRVFVRMYWEDTAALTDEGWVIRDKVGLPRFASGDTIAIAAPVVGPVLTLKLVRLSDTIVSLADVSHAVAREHGYSDVAELWQDFAFRHDSPAYKFWLYCKRHLGRVDHADVFRRFIETRDMRVWRAWSLWVALESVSLSVQTGQVS